MKLCVVVLLGAADRPVTALDGNTPIAAARTPHLASLSAGGRVGAVLTVPKKVKPSVEAALATLFGLDPALHSPAPGALLAAALGIELDRGERAFRCDLVNQYAGTVVDPTAGMLGPKEAGILTKALADELDTGKVRFLPGMRWRSLLVVGEGVAEKVKTTASARFLGEPLTEHLPGKRGAQLRRLMDSAGVVLAEHEINAVRIDLGENPANAVWIWGGGRGRECPALAEAGGIAIGSHPTFLGLAREAGLTILPSNPEAEPGQEPQVVAEAALAALDQVDLVMVALEGGLIYSRLGEAEAKREWCETVDEMLLGPLAERLVATGEGRLLVLPSHVAATEARRDRPGMVPFLVAGPGTSSYGGAVFSEAGAEEADLKVTNGGELLEFAGRQ